MAKTRAVLPRKSSFRWGDYITAYAAYSSRKGGKELLINCPFCADTKNHMSVRIDKGYAHCHRCGVNPTPLDLIANLECIPRSEAVRRLESYSSKIKGTVLTLRDRLGMAVERDADPLENTSRNTLHLPVVSPLTDLAMEYLAQRGIDAQTARHFGLAVIKQGYMEGRIYIPIRYRGKVVSYQARTMDPDEERRYLFPIGGFPVKSIFYNLDGITEGWVVMVEGPFDTMAVWQSGERNVLGIFGKRLTDDQKALLMQNNIKGVYIMLDPDAIKDALNMAKEISPFKPVRIARLNGGDPADCPGEIAPALDNSIDYEPQKHLKILIG